MTKISANKERAKGDKYQKNLLAGRHNEVNSPLSMAAYIHSNYFFLLPFKLHKTDYLEGILCFLFIESLFSIYRICFLFIVLHQRCLNNISTTI